MMDDDLLTAAREKADVLRKRAQSYRQAAEEAEDELHSAIAAVEMIERLQREDHDAFNARAGVFLKGT